MVHICNVLFIVFAAVATSETVKAGKGGENKADSSNAGPKCAQQEQRIADLQKELAAAPQGECQPFSLVDPLMKAYSTSGEIISRIYEIGQQNEKVVAVTSKVFDHSKRALEMVAEKVSAVDYAKHMQVVKDHELYKKHAAPQIEKFANGPLKEHIYPTVEKVKVNVVPMLQTAKDKSAVVYKRAREEALPFLQTASSKAADHISKIPVEKALSPIFNQLEKMAPEQANALPKKTADRVVLILLVLLFLWRAIAWARPLFRIVRLFVRIPLKIVFFALRVVLFIPMRLTFKILRITMCICTGFYCCGLCRRKRKVTDLKEKAAKSGKAKATDDKKAVETKKESKESSNEVSVADISEYLEQRKKENRKLDEYVQQFATSAKGGKALTQKGLKGKMISKDTLKKACANFKEIDIKKLGL